MSRKPNERTQNKCKRSIKIVVIIEIIYRTPADIWNNNNSSSHRVRLSLIITTIILYIILYVYLHLRRNGMQSWIDIFTVFLIYTNNTAQKSFFSNRFTRMALFIQLVLEIIKWFCFLDFFIRVFGPGNKLSLVALTT